MESEFVSLTFVRACTAFKTTATALPGHHPMTITVGMNGCVGIFRDPKGGFDVFGLDGQHFWVAPENVIWGRKSTVVHPGNLVEQTPIKTDPAPVESKHETITDIMKTVADKMPWVEPPKPPPVSPRPVGRPRKK